MTSTGQATNHLNTHHPRHNHTNKAHNQPTNHRHKFHTNPHLLCLTKLPLVYPILCTPTHRQHTTNHHTHNQHTTNHKCHTTNLYTHNQRCHTTNNTTNLHTHSPKCLTADPHTTQSKPYNPATNLRTQYTVTNQSPVQPNLPNLPRNHQKETIHPTHPTHILIHISKPGIGNL